jgi:hypothetical protein
MMLDAGKAEIQKELLTMELDAVGIRINRRRPDVTIKHKKSGGVSVTSTCGDLTHLDVHQVRNILHLYKMHNVDVLVREDVTVDEFIDVVEGNRIYLRCLSVEGKGKFSQQAMGAYFGFILADVFALSLCISLVPQLRDQQDRQRAFGRSGSSGPFPRYRRDQLSREIEFGFSIG